MFSIYFSEYRQQFFCIFRFRKPKFKSLSACIYSLSLFCCWGENYNLHCTTKSSLLPPHFVEKWKRKRHKNLGIKMFFFCLVSLVCCTRATICKHTCVLFAATTTTTNNNNKRQMRVFIIYFVYGFDGCPRAVHDAWNICFEWGEITHFDEVVVGRHRTDEYTAMCCGAAV